MIDQIPIKKIIHVDMDAFYASVEQLDDPELRGKPVAVGGGGERGVIAAASYEARVFGVRSAMSGNLAKRKCPHLIFVKPRMERYKELSMKIRDIFHDYTELVEPLSLDEAFLDVTHSDQGMTATKMAKEIRTRIFEEVGLIASAGISINKFTAKIASDINKPNGQKTILPEEVIPFLEELPIEKFFGVGKVTAEKMNSLGIFKGKDLKAQSMEFLARNFGKSGRHFYEIVRGIQHSEVKPNRIRKSIAAERTYITDLTSATEMIEKLTLIAEELERRMQRSQVRGKTITVKIKHYDFTLQSRSRTQEEWLCSKEEIMAITKELIVQSKIEKPVRLLGISMSKLDNDEEESEVWTQLKIDFPDWKF